MGMVIDQYEVYLVNLDPSVGHEIKKTRPCLVISPDEMNHAISTVIIAPMTTKSHPYPTRVPVKFDNKNGSLKLNNSQSINFGSCSIRARNAHTSISDVCDEQTRQLTRQPYLAAEVILWSVLDQIRTVDAIRLVTCLGKIKQKEIREVKAVIKNMLVD